MTAALVRMTMLLLLLTMMMMIPLAEHRDGGMEGGTAALEDGGAGADGGGVGGQARQGRRGAGPHQAEKDAQADVER
jgi:hypothetical protein